MMDAVVDSRSTDLPARSACLAAQRNFSANLCALRQSQPTVADALGSLPADVEWVYARDGALTGLRDGRVWWAGCSLPARAAAFMLKKAELDGAVLCFLYAQHAAQLRVTLDRATPGQACLALIPDLTTLGMILACDDFSAAIAAHRLYLTAGDAWESQLDELLGALPGLPTPTQFIRPILADSSPADAMIEPAQKVFAEHTRRRSAHVLAMRESWKSSGVRRICVVAPALFRLWDDAGAALAGAMTNLADGMTACLFNPDDPATASPSALAALATTCDAIIAPNTSRAALPDLLPEEMPWATWLTLPQIPPAEQTGPHDTLLLADPAWKEMCIAKGWEPRRIFIAGWPRTPGEDLASKPRRVGGEDQAIRAPGATRAMTARDTSGAVRCGPGNDRAHRPLLLMISNTKPLDPPPGVTEYSSHRLLWESIQHELLEDPFALADLPDVYLSRRMQRARIDAEGFDHRAFLDGVILHAWQQGIARILIREKAPLKLHGKGWDEIEEFIPYAAGAIDSRESLQDAVDAASALVHAWPTPYVHAIEAAGKPLIRPTGNRQAFVRDVNLALTGQFQSPTRSGDALSSEVIVQALSWRGKKQP